MSKTIIFCGIFLLSMVGCEKSNKKEYFGLFYIDIDTSTLILNNTKTDCSFPNEICYFNYERIDNTFTLNISKDNYGNNFPLSVNLLNGLCETLNVDYGENVKWINKNFYNENIILLEYQIINNYYITAYLLLNNNTIKFSFWCNIEDLSGKKEFNKLIKSIEIINPIRVSQLH